MPKLGGQCSIGYHIKSRQKRSKKADDKSTGSGGRDDKVNGPVGGSLATALVRDSKSQFIKYILNCHVPEKFKLPTLESYDESTDLVDHWQQYSNMMGL